ncbi:EpsG family protein [Aquimarina sp. 2-A2]|uniref:EpsG family protein n=1 Tax=Aquimarina sp. 2-A2 TaxID=3382644 RepID=UPI00387F2952
MIDFVPLEYYFSLYINLMLLVVVLTLLHSVLMRVDDTVNLRYTQITGYILLFFSIFYIGLRPVSGAYFIDMITYARYFEYYAIGGEVVVEKDAFFHFFMKFTSGFLPIHGFFLLCAAMYIYPMYRISKVLFKEYWYYSFLMLIVSFSFWPYGVNGIRNGIATSVFLLAITYHDRKFIMFSLFALCSLFHQTLLLPILAYSLTIFYNKPKYYIVGWLVAIPLSLAFGGMWETLFTSLGFADDRLENYLTSTELGGRTSFRFDFLFYSAFAVFTGWYFIFKKGFKDSLYIQLFNTYLVANAFWILVIRANFSNRFAYLSWFLMAIIIIYPFLKKHFFVKHHVIIGRVVLFYFAFTYLMYFVYYAGK